VEIRQLEVFLAVMESGSVTRGADRLGLTPGAVSIQLQKLAIELRTELFIRSGKRLLPTPNADRLAEQGRAIVTSMRKMEEEFAEDGVVDPHPFSFATGATTLIHRLGRPLRQLRKKFPKTQILVTVANTEEIVDGLHARRFDLGLISLPVVEDGLKLIPLFDEEMLLLRPSPVRVRGGHVGTIKPEEVAGSPFLLYPKKSNMRGLIDTYLREMGLQPNVLMEADDTEALKRLVEAGFGCSVLPEFALRGQSRFYHTSRLAGRRLVRHQALAMPVARYPRKVAQSIAKFLQASLAASGDKAEE